jgi:3-deoxy-7-phosphoheptulonate synthase
MVESHLVAGRQDLVPGKELTYGQSVTDGCIDWDSSVQVLQGLAAAVRQRRIATQAAKARQISLCGPNGALGPFFCV